MSLVDFPVATLSNGKIVGNFSSPHEFIFEDGTVLPACSAEIAEKYKVTFEEEVDEISPRWHDISLSFTLSDDVWARMGAWMELVDKQLVDIVFCPLPMLTALREFEGQQFINESPYRSIRIVDRISKLCSITKQCV